MYWWAAAWCDTTSKTWVFDRAAMYWWTAAGCDTTSIALVFNWAAANWTAVSYWRWAVYNALQWTSVADRWAAANNWCMANRWWMTGSDEVSQLWVGETTISTCVNSSDNLNKFILKSIGSMCSEEARKIASVDISLVAFVNSSVAGEWCIITSKLQVTFECFKFSPQCKFLFNYFLESELNVTW